MAFIKFKSYMYTPTCVITTEPRIITINTDNIEFVCPEYKQIYSEDTDELYLTFIAIHTTSDKIFYCLPDDKENKPLYDIVGLDFD